jgi:N-succinyldiaminopimelate aminotransferase
VCAETGRHDYARCNCVFHSLSKRSNLPGLRSGFVAGDAKLLKPYLLYRTYHGAAMPVHNQRASIMAWLDEAHVMENRHALPPEICRVHIHSGPGILAALPDAGFYFWMRTPIDDDVFTQRLYEEKNVTVLPWALSGTRGE